MRYDLTNKRTLTENLQRMLRYLSSATSTPELRVNVDGEYGENTASAVRYFQRKEGIPVSGEVDLETWNRIKREYEREQDARQDVFILPIPSDAGYRTQRGERSDTVSILQIILSALRLVYEYPEVQMSGIYSPQTEEAVRVFQRANGLADSGIADRATWKRLAEEYNALPNQ